MTENKYNVTTWGKPVFQDLEVPSGQMCQVRLPGVQAMISAGVLESADTLSTLVDQKHIKRVQGRGKKEPEIDTKALLKDAGNMTRVFEMCDRVAEYMVVQPVLRRPIRVVEQADGKRVEEPLPASDREDGVIYTDMVDLQDKMYIFSYAVGGDTDLESFRERFGEGVGSVAAK